MFGNASSYACFSCGIGDGFGDGRDHVFIKDAGNNIIFIERIIVVGFSFSHDVSQNDAAPNNKVELGTDLVRQLS